jgi:uncharacterized protein
VWNVRRLVRIVGVAVLGYFFVMAALWVLQRRMIYLPSQVVPPVASVHPDAEEVVLVTDDGLSLDAWFLPRSGAGFGVTVVVFNGNAGNRAHRAGLATMLSGRGFDVLLTDYRGYGGNPGSPTEAGLAADARAAVDHLVGRDDVDPDRLVYFGESLGAAVAIGLAVERPPAALVLRSPFTSLPDIASAHYRFLPVSWLLWDRYPSLDRIEGIDVPVLIIAGTDDRIVPFSQSLRLYEAVPGPKDLLAVEGADHNDPALTVGVEMADRIAGFVAEMVEGRSE